MKDFFNNIVIPSCYATAAYLSIDCQSVQILTILILIDMFVGTFANVASGDSFSKKKFLTGFLSKIFALLVPVVTALVGKVMGMDASPLVSISIGLLCVNEAISIFENFITLKTGTKSESKDLVTPLLRLLIGFFQKIIEKLMTALKEFK